MTRIVVFDEILLPNQRPLRALLTIRSEPIGDDVRTSYTVHLYTGTLHTLRCASL